MGQKRMIVELQNKIVKLPKEFNEYNLVLNYESDIITYTYDTKNENLGITSLLQILKDNSIKIKDIKTEQSSLENIFINLVKESKDEF